MSGRSRSRTTSATITQSTSSSPNAPIPSPPMPAPPLSMSDPSWIEKMNAINNHLNNAMARQQIPGDSLVSFSVTTETPQSTTQSGARGPRGPRKAMTPQERAQLRLQRKAEAARASRKRKKEHLQSLEEQVQKLSEEVNALNEREGPKDPVGVFPIDVYEDQQAVLKTRLSDVLKQLQKQRIQEGVSPNPSSSSLSSSLSPSSPQDDELLAPLSMSVAEELSALCGALILSSQTLQSSVDPLFDLLLDKLKPQPETALLLLSLTESADHLSDTFPEATNDPNQSSSLSQDNDGDNTSVATALTNVTPLSASSAGSSLPSQHSSSSSPSLSSSSSSSSSSTPIPSPTAIFHAVAQCDIGKNNCPTLFGANDCHPSSSLSSSSSSSSKPFTPNPFALPSFSNRPRPTPLHDPSIPTNPRLCAFGSTRLQAEEVMKSTYSLAHTIANVQDGIHIHRAERASVVTDILRALNVEEVARLIDTADEIANDTNTYDPIVDNAMEEACAKVGHQRSPTSSSSSLPSSSSSSKNDDPNPPHHYSDTMTGRAYFCNRPGVKACSTADLLKQAFPDLVTVVTALDAEDVKEAKEREEQARLQRYEEERNRARNAIYGHMGQGMGTGNNTNNNNNINNNINNINNNYHGHGGDNGNSDVVVGRGGIPMRGQSSRSYPYNTTGIINNTWQQQQQQHQQQQSPYHQQQQGYPHQQYHGNIFTHQTQNQNR